MHRAVVFTVPLLIIFLLLPWEYVAHGGFSAVSGAVAKYEKRKAKKKKKKKPRQWCLQRFGFVGFFLFCFLMGYWVGEKEMWF